MFGIPNHFPYFFSTFIPQKIVDFSMKMWVGVSTTLVTRLQLREHQSISDATVWVKSPIQRSHRCSCQPFHMIDWYLHLYIEYNFIWISIYLEFFLLLSVSPLLLLTFVQLYLSIPVKSRFSARVVRFACLKNGWFCNSTIFGRSSGYLFIRKKKKNNFIIISEKIHKFQTSLNYIYLSIQISANLWKWSVNFRSR